MKEKGKLIESPESSVPSHGAAEIGAGAENTAGVRDLTIRTPMPPKSAEMFWQTLPHCIGYPGCDGDLERTSHEPGCPLFGKKSDISMTDFAEAYVVWLAEAENHHG